MSVVIQNAATGKFAAPQGRWTRNIGKALRFEQVLRAWDEIGDRGLNGVRILFWPEREQAPVLVKAI